MFTFIQPQHVKDLKSLKLVFQTSTSLQDPFIENIKVHRSYEEKTLSDSEFEKALKAVYDNLEAHIKAMVTWEYYLEQAKQNKQKIEASLITAKTPSVVLADAKHYNNAVCLRLFPSLHQVSYWADHGKGHTGIAIELDTDHEYFTSSKCEVGPQMFLPVIYDDLRPSPPTKQQPFPALFKRPEQCAFEQEWRLIRPAVKDSVEHAFKIPKGVIKGLYAGINCSRDTIEELAQLVKLDLQFRHVNLHQMAVSETHLRLQPLALSDYF